MFASESSYHTICTMHIVISS